MKIVPHLWFDKEAVEAANFYVSAIENSKINWKYTITDTPSGDAELVEFTLANFTMAAISAGDFFKLNESISFMLNCNSKEEVQRLYDIFIEGGMELMPLGEYDFCPFYVWLKDKFGTNWQIMFEENQAEKHQIDICFLFDLEQAGNALPALEFYNEIFQGSKLGRLSYYDGSQPDKRAKINYGELCFDNFKFIMMDHGYGGNVTFNEAFSIMILCDNQEELDYYWEKLSYVKEAEQCGWVKDKFGVSWQICPITLMKLYDKNPDNLAEINQKVLSLKKINFSDIE